MEKKIMPLNNKVSIIIVFQSYKSIHYSPACPKDMSYRRVFVYESLFNMLGKIAKLKDRQDFLRSITSEQ